MVLRKRILLILLCMVLSFMPTMVSYKKAKADAFAATWIAVGSGFTLGGALSVIIPVAAVGLGIYVVVDNWDAITGTVANALEKSTGAVKDWYNDLKSECINVQSGTTYEEDRIAGSPVSLYSYQRLSAEKKLIVPKEVVTEIQEIIQDEVIGGKVAPPINTDIIDYFQDYQIRKKDFYSLDDMKNNIKDLIPFIYDNTLYNNFLVIGNSVPLNSSYTVAILNINNISIKMSISKNKTDNTLQIQPMVYLDKTDIPLTSFSIDRRTDKWIKSTNTFTLGEDGLLYKMSDLKTDFNYDLYVNNNKELPFTIKNKIINKIAYVFQYCSVPVDIEFIDEYDYLMPGGFTHKLDDRVVLNDSFGLTTLEGVLEKDDDTPWIINPNDVLGRYVNEKEYVNTDQVIKDIINADKESIRTGEKVINIDITDVPDDIGNPPVAGQKDYTEQLTDIHQGVLDLPRSIASEFETMLLNNPSLSISDKEKIMTIMELTEGRTSLFNYPIAVLIKFFNRVMNIGNIDCILTLPPIKVFDRTIYSGTNLNLSEVVRRTEYIELYGYYRIVSNAIITFLFVNFIVKKSKRFFNN